MAPRPSWPARRSSAPPTRRPRSGRCAPPRRPRNAMDVVDALAHRGRFFRVLQQTERSQTAVMTIAPGEDGGPEEEHDGDQIVYVVEGGGDRADRRHGTSRRGGVARHDPRPNTPSREESGADAPLLRDRL